MKIAHLATFLIAICSINATAQRWGFKEDTLGESLQEFQSRYPHITEADQSKQCEQLSPPSNASKAQRREWENHRFETYTACMTAQQDHQVVPRSLGCSPAHTIPNGITCVLITTLLGKETSAYYSFLNAKLYQIQVVFAQSEFENVVGTARDKYGKPSDTGSREYQNAFGARFDGRYALWTQGSDVLTVDEIQDKYSSVLLIMDSTIERQLEKPKNPSDF